ncbi:MAG TPA: PIN domain-containing protein [Anaerolineae bacterium]|nr:PIN domain-containing protein [Anaerolineae bacterium]
MNIFVDTGAFYALADTDDVHHAEATESYTGGFGAHHFFTGDYVIIETWLLIRNKLSRPTAMTFWQSIRAGVVGVLHVMPDDVERAWRICERFADQDFSLVDAVSCALMERAGIASAFAFDHHFSVYRTDRNQAFERLP